MKLNIQTALNFMLQHECTYESGHEGDLNYVTWEDVPGDSGGLTKWGIDQADHPHLDIKALTYTQAIQIYHDEEWTRCRCDDLPEGYDIATFDIAVNNGSGTAVKLLQQALNQAGDLNPPLAVDGFIGPATIAAANAGGPSGLRRLLILRQKLYYNIVTSHPTDRKFLKGWTNRNNDLATLVNVNFNAIA